MQNRYYSLQLISEHITFNYREFNLALEGLLGRKYERKLRSNE